MTCKQMGGPCDTAFQGDSADEVWRNPIRGMGWYRQTKKDFAALPDDAAAPNLA